MRAIPKNVRIEMNFENAKAMLRNATSDQERDDAIDQAMKSGMPLVMIEQYLDWLDSTARTKTKADSIRNSDKKTAHSKSEFCPEKNDSNAQNGGAEKKAGNSDQVAESD